jgi:F420-dependent oxidoreductase-like protein
MKLALMIEGQEDVTWDQWMALATACEEHRLDGLFRSDHYASVRDGPPRGSLDAWTTLAGLAARTAHLRLGTLVSPVTFRHPSLVAKTATTVDHISGGRVELGLGAGWLESEHDSYGFPFPPPATRVRLLEEQLEIVHRQWTEDEFSFEGEHYHLRANSSLPKPVQRPHPPVILGGMGGARSLRLAVEWADEYNTFEAWPDECRRRRERLLRMCEKRDRDPQTLRFSMMMPCVTGVDWADVRRRMGRLLEIIGRDADAGEFTEEKRHEYLVGPVDEIIESLLEFKAAGVERAMLGHLVHDDIDMVELLGREILPAVGNAAHKGRGS